MFAEVFLRSKFAAIGASCYVLAFVCALLYPLFDHSTFSGLIAVLLALPWSDYLPSGGPRLILLVGCAALNAIIIYVVLAALSLVPSMIRQRRP
jgi:hypothetical protein